MSTDAERPPGCRIQVEESGDVLTVIVPGRITSTFLLTMGMAVFMAIFVGATMAKMGIEHRDSLRAGVKRVADGAKNLRIAPPWKTSTR